jgi:hypothetical protein
MRHRVLTIIRAATAGAAALSILQAHAAGQPLPRTPDGHPDLQGTFDIATLTPLERPAGLPAVLPDAEAVKLERQVAQRNAQAAAPSRGDRQAPPVGGDGSTGPAGNVGGYNNFWLDAGSKYLTVNGEKRTSLIVDPPDGRVPALTPEARARNAQRSAAARLTSDEQANMNDPGLEGPGAYDDPERRPLGERCLLGFGSTSGPPALPVLYNNLHQIVQTRDVVMILTEMNHDARIVRMNGQHLPAAIHKWTGDSVGRWEGDTLVVDTTNFTDKTRFRGSSDQLHVQERLSRIDTKTLLYRFIVDDPATWVRSWTGEAVWPATNDRLYEYACHEGNYALGDILRGARLRETEELAKRSRK